MSAIAHRLEPFRDVTGVILGAGLALAALVGAVLAVDVKVGFALLLAVCFAAVLSVDLKLGLALWVPLVFLEGIPVFNLAGKAAGILIVVAWMGNLGTRGGVVRTVLTENRVLVGLVVALLVWFTLSVAWAEDVALALDEVWVWAALLAMFVVVATTITDERSLRRILFAFVAGAVFSIAIGVADGSFTGDAAGGARLEGGAGDPNYLAASLIATSVIAVSLLAVPMGVLARLALVGALAILVAGLVSSGSRGGFLAAAAALLLALFIFKNRRAHVAALAALVFGAGALAFLNVPGAWDRITDFEDSNGRSGLWTVGARMWADEPVAGVGLNNFFTHSADYVREPGSLEDVHVIVERPHVPHNTYLQLLAETGIVGLVLFVAACVAALRAALVAARRLEARGSPGLGAVSRGMAVAMGSILAASMFLSTGTDKRLWLLMALSAGLAAATSMRAGFGARGRGMGDPARASETELIAPGRS